MQSKEEVPLTGFVWASMKNSPLRLNGGSDYEIGGGQGGEEGKEKGKS